MRTIYERETEKEEIINGKKEIIKEMVESNKAQATHKHTCFHDEADDMGQCRPCKREKI